MPMLPERINFAISRRCAVACPGCYSLFGQDEPVREAFMRSAAAFVACGVRTMTLSGGDPLLLPDLGAWLAGFRAAGMQILKLDTVGIGMLAPERPGALSAAALLAAVDQLAIPLDGWDNASAALFRRGRADLHDRTVELLNELDAEATAPKLVVNTVVHRHNIERLEQLAAIVLPLRALAQWNLFQYTPTDQARAGANDTFAVTDAAFGAAQARLLARPAAQPRVACRSIADRLGHYLLVNSDGVAWLPDAQGLTCSLGSIFGREAEVLGRWAAAVRALQRSGAMA